MGNTKPLAPIFVMSKVYAPSQSNISLCVVANQPTIYPDQTKFLVTCHAHKLMVESLGLHESQALMFQPSFCQVCMPPQEHK